MRLFYFQRGANDIQCHASYRTLGRVPAGNRPSTRVSRVSRLCPVFRTQPGACPPEEKNGRCADVRENGKFDRSPAQRVRSKEEMQRNGRDLPLAAGRGIWSLHRRSGEAGQSRGVVRTPRRSHLPAVRAVSGLCEDVPKAAKKSPPFQGKRRGSAEIVRRDSALLRDAGLGRVWAAGQHLLHLTPTQEHR